MGPTESVRTIRSNQEREAEVPESGPDRVLMDRIRDGDREAYQTLLERYWPPLVVYATGIVEGEDAAKDVVQDAFIRVWRRRSDWTPSGPVSAYLYRITRNLALNARRDRTAEMGRREKGARDLLSAMPRNNPQDELAVSSLREEVEAAIAGLPDRRREAFVLSRFHGLSYSEIAEAMGISTQTVANQMRAALAQLRHVLAEHLDEVD